MIPRTKPNTISKSINVDQTVTKFVVFCDENLSIANDASLEDWQDLAVSEDIQIVEVYGLEQGNVENGTIEVGGVQFRTFKGEKRYTGDVMTTYLNGLDDYAYYSNKYAYLVTINDIVRGVPDGDNINPIPLNQVVGGDKELVNDGSSASTPKIMFNVAGSQVNKVDEWTLDFQFDNISTAEASASLDMALDSGLN